VYERFSCRINGHIYSLFLRFISSNDSSLYRAVSFESSRQGIIKGLSNFQRGCKIVLRAILASRIAPLRSTRQHAPLRHDVYVADFRRVGATKVISLKETMRPFFRYTFYVSERRNSLNPGSEI